MSTKIMCLKCGHEWQYTGSATRATCPSCKNKISLDTKRHHFVSLDLGKFSKDIEIAHYKGKEFVVLDCLGSNVIDVSTID